MSKNLLIAGAVVLASSSVALANGGSYTPPVHHKDHTVYVGVGVSRDSLHTEFQDAAALEATVSPAVGAVTSISGFRAADLDLGATGWNGDLFAGIGWTFQDRYYLGGEIFGSINNTRINADVAAGLAALDDDGNVVESETRLDHTRFQLRNTYGVSLIPGVKISDSTLIYGRIGWVRGRFRTTTSTLIETVNNTPAVGDDPTPAPTPVETRANSNRNGLQLGLGLEAMVSNNVGVRLEYDYTRFSSLTASADFGLDDRTFVINNHTYNGSDVKVSEVARLRRPTLNQVKLAIDYHFDAA